MSGVAKFFISLAVFAAICAGGLYWFVNHEVERAFNQAVDDVPGLILTYADISVDFADQSVVLDQVEAALPGGQRVSAEQVRVTAFDQKNPVPHFAAATARGLTMQATPANVGSWAGPLASLGIGEIHGDLAVDYAFDPDAGALTVKTLALSSPELGDLDLTGTVDRLDLAQLRVEKLVGLRVVRADLAYEDRAMVRLLLRSTARLLGVSVDEARQRVRAEIAAMAEYAVRDDNPVAADALAGLSEFIAAPGRIAVSARPAEPVPVLYFFMGRDFYDNLHLLNVTVTTDYERAI
jgi:hypothetical protein